MHQAQNLPFTSSFFFLPSTTQLCCPHSTGDKVAARGGGMSCQVTAGGGSEIRARSSVLQLDLCRLSVVHMLKPVSPCPAESTLLCPVASKPHGPGLRVASLPLETKGAQGPSVSVKCRFPGNSKAFAPCLWLCLAASVTRGTLLPH